MNKFKAKVMFVAIFVLLSSCATGSWQHGSGQSSNTSYDESSCQSYSATKVPIYICANPLMCVGDEIGRVWSDIANRENAFKSCMHKKGYRYVTE